MPLYEPVPVPAFIDAIKQAYNISSDEEAGQPKIVREFLETLPVSPKLRKVEKEEMDIEMNGIKVNISIIRPPGSKDKVLPTLLFLHGGGWAVGSYRSHGILSNELANVLPCCVIFVNYSLSPEVKYPVALEECYATLCWIKKNGASIHADPNSIAVVGDSAGGNLAAALTLYAKDRGNTDISCQILYYPIVDADFHTESYEKNKDNAILPLKSMEYAFRSYLDSPEQHKIHTVVPMAATIDQLKGLPPTLIVTAENDVLRSEGELFGKKLVEAGVDTVSVCYSNVNHGFLTLLENEAQVEAAIAQTAYLLKKHWKSSSGTELL